MDRLRRRRPWLVAGLSVVLLSVAFVSWMAWVEPKPLPPRDQVIPQSPLQPAGRSSARGEIDHGSDTLPAFQAIYNTGPAVETTPPGPDVDLLKVGVFMINNYDMDMTVPMASSTGRLWFRWQEPLQKTFEALQTTPADLLSFPNQTQSWNGQLKLLSQTPVRLPNGEYYQRVQFDENFYIPDLGIRHYPFQTVHIPLIVKVNDEAGSFTFNNLRLVPDLGQSGIGRFIDLNGFVVTGWNMGEFRHQYGTSFGLDTPGQSVDSTSLSELIFDVTYTRSVRSSVWTLFQPLAIVMATVILSPTLSSRFWDIRIAIPATAILTMVFLQQSYRASLPDLPFTTFIDRVYVICYVICLACFLLYVWAANYLQNSGADREQEVAREIDRMDVRFQWICVIGLAVGSLISWFRV